MGKVKDRLLKKYSFTNKRWPKQRKWRRKKAAYKLQLIICLYRRTLLFNPHDLKQLPARPPWSGPLISKPSASADIQFYLALLSNHFLIPSFLVFLVLFNFLCHVHPKRMIILVQHNGINWKRFESTYIWGELVDILHLFIL